MQCTYMSLVSGCAAVSESESESVGEHAQLFLRVPLFALCAPLAGADLYELFVAPVCTCS